MARQGDISVALLSANRQFLSYLTAIGIGEILWVQHPDMALEGMEKGWLDSLLAIGSIHPRTTTLISISTRQDAEC